MGHHKRKDFSSPYFLKMGGEILAFQGLIFVTFSVQDFVALVLHAAFSISDLMLYSQKFTWSIQFLLYSSLNRFQRGVSNSFQLMYIVDIKKRSLLSNVAMLQQE